jgi:hypothetical protein
VQQGSSPTKINDTKSRIGPIRIPAKVTYNTSATGTIITLESPIERAIRFQKPYIIVLWKKCNKETISWDEHDDRQVNILGKAVSFTTERELTTILICKPEHD